MVRRPWSIFDGDLTMAKKTMKHKTVRARQRGVNWTVIVGIGVVALLLLAALLLWFPTNGDEAQPPAQAGLPAYCEQNPDNCVATGAEAAPVTLLEIFDFACIHCRNFNQDVLPLLKSQYQESGQVRFVSLPFASRPDTLPASNASLCANEQGAYFEYTDAVFRQYGEPGYLSQAQLLQTAVSLNLDRDQFAACMDEGRYNILISDNVGYAHSVGISGTPNFFINDIHVTGNQPELIRQRIEMALRNQ
jgi:protein-disulfide isomerase